jgi:hypothetical protein
MDIRFALGFSRKTKKYLLDSAFSFLLDLGALFASAVACLGIE